jgi:hypothetical protein
MTALRACYVIESGNPRRVTTLAINDAYLEVLLIPRAIRVLEGQDRQHVLFALPETIERRGSYALQTERREGCILLSKRLDVNLVSFQAED